MLSFRSCLATGAGVLVLCAGCGSSDASPSGTPPLSRTAVFPKVGPWPKPVLWEGSHEVVTGPVRFDTTMAGPNGESLSITIECDLGQELWMMGALRSEYVCFDEGDTP